MACRRTGAVHFFSACGIRGCCVLPSPRLILPLLQVFHERQNVAVAQVPRQRLAHDILSMRGILCRFYLMLPVHAILRKLPLHSKMLLLVLL